MQNRRRFTRIHPADLTAQTGKVLVDPEAPAIDCDVVDISAGGACITVHGSGAIPQNFVLLYGGAKMNCTAAWIDGRRVGVAF